MPATEPANELERLAALTSLEILDTPAEAGFDRLTSLASSVFGCPIALISLVDEHRQWFKSRVGLEAQETSRDLAFCAHAIHSDEVFCVPDAALDPRFRENALVTGGPHIRFYAGAPLRTKDGHRLGTLCVIDVAPRERLSDAQNRVLQELAALVMDEVELKTLNRDIHSLNKALTHLAAEDSLTKLPNRLRFERDLEKALMPGVLPSGIPALLYVDVDRFGRVNDRFGFARGDELLTLIARRIQNTVRRSGVVYRMGSDKFIVLIKDGLDRGAAEMTANEIIGELKAPFELSSGRMFISASVGISFFPEHGPDGASLMRNAALALRHAKRSGKNQAHCFSRELHDAGERAELTEEHLHQALEENHFELYYQPQVRPSGEVVGFEALVRLNHPALGLVPPDRFIPLAEESGMIVEMGYWILREACLQGALLQREHGYRFAVNISAIQLADGRFLDKLADALRTSAFDPNLLELELTESTLIGDPEGSIALLQDLKKLGVRVAIDDFGTGYSSLGYLHRLPFDILKIDKRFVADLESTPSTLPLVRAILAMAQNMSLSVVAEGVESAGQLRVLAAAGCDAFQGYLFGRPLPANRIDFDRKIVPGMPIDSALSFQPRLTLH